MSNKRKQPGRQEKEPNRERPDERIEDLDVQDTELESVVGGADPGQEISFSYGAMKVHYEPQKTDGS